MYLISPICINKYGNHPQLYNRCDFSEDFYETRARWTTFVFKGHPYVQNFMTILLTD
jgi:hypothetical protein